MLNDKISDEEINGMLLMQQAELEQKLLEDLQRFRRIQSRLVQGPTGQVADVILKSVPV
jgi:hypothetical protein